MWTKTFSHTQNPYVNTHSHPNLTKPKKETERKTQERKRTLLLIINSFRVIFLYTHNSFLFFLYFATFNNHIVLELKFCFLTFPRDFIFIYFYFCSSSVSVIPRSYREIIFVFVLTKRKRKKRNSNKKGDKI